MYKMSSYFVYICMYIKLQKIYYFMYKMSAFNNKKKK
jgi:hypothetical protein